ncbi:hypothetical protein PR048_024295 [Dryococelus australis]|uniref:Uncharacterized protein n=1 Tax=Dryococelus australis TaxID=614101 RepID=A0ABQ9GN68_9NEOP|nr:hypothetical protein PR048_024295 [Dryococelus australis]
MPLVGGFSRGSPVSLAVSFRPYAPHFILIGSQDLDRTAREKKKVQTVLAPALTKLCLGRVAGSLIDLGLKVVLTDLVSVLGLHVANTILLFIRAWSGLGTVNSEVLRADEGSNPGSPWWKASTLATTTLCGLTHRRHVVSVEIGSVTQLISNWKGIDNGLYKKHPLHSLGVISETVERPELRRLERKSISGPRSLRTQLLAATCGAAPEVNNNLSLAPKEAVPRHQQPAVGVAAVAAAPCTSCRPGFLAPPAPYQQPWAGVTAPAAPAHPLHLQAAAVGRHRGARAAAEPGPEQAAAPRRASTATWGTRAAKRSRTAHAQDVSGASAPAWPPQFLQPAPAAALVATGVTPDAPLPRTTWAQCTPCGKECKACCLRSEQQQQQQQQQQQLQQQQQQQWSSYYCRGASEDASRILWNNENMLRLFQYGAEPERKGAGETADPRENQPTSGIVRHDSRVQKSGN